MAVEPSGRLELTCTNKHLRLLADESSGYSWVAPSDYRVAEVRLLHDVGTVGDVHAKRRRAEDNLLIQGDALHALTSLCELPEFSAEYVGKVKLAYLDPPFNAQQAFEHYDDALEHSVWLTMLRDRLLQIRTLADERGRNPNPARWALAQPRHRTSDQLENRSRNPLRPVPESLAADSRNNPLVVGNSSPFGKHNFLNFPSRKSHAIANREPPAKRGIETCCR